MRVELKLPGVVNDALERDVAFLRTATSPLPPGIEVPEGMKILCEPARDAKSPLTRQTQCPVCRGLCYVVVQEHGGRLVPCGICEGTGQATGVVRAVVIEAIDGAMPKTAELVRFFAPRPGQVPIHFLPSLLLRRRGSIRARKNGLALEDFGRSLDMATVWTDLQGERLSGFRHGLLGPVMRAGVACGVQLFSKPGERGGRGHLEVVGALKGHVIREKIGDFSWVDERGKRPVNFPAYDSLTAEDVVKAWGVDLEAVIKTAFKIAEGDQGAETPTDTAEAVEGDGE